jgi:LysM domain-containing protein
MTTLTVDRRRTPKHGATPARLTPRGRIVFLAVTVALMFAALVIWGPRSAAVPIGTKPEPTRMVALQPGESLWDVAKQVAPHTDPRVTIERILSINALPDAGDLQIGQLLTVPLR